MYGLLDQIKIRLRMYEKNEDGDIVFKDDEDPILNVLIEQAKKEIIDYRHYPESYSGEKIQVDLEQYEGLIINLVIYDYNHEGMEFELSHTEPGVTRSWTERQKLLGVVTPFVNFL